MVALVAEISFECCRVVTNSTGLSVLAFSTRSSSGSASNPNTEILSSSNGTAEVKPTNWNAIDAVDTASQVANALATSVEQGRLRSGDKAMLLGIGSGLNCTMLGIEW